MTHTMHRLSAAGDDFIIHVRPPKGRKEGTGPVLGDLLERLCACHPVNAGSPAAGTLLTKPLDTLIRTWPDGAPLHVVFDTEENLLAAVRLLDEANTGFSVSVCAPLGTVMRLEGQGHVHTMGYQMDLTPEEEEDWLSRLLSLCGHLRLSAGNARRLCEEIRQGKCSAEEAARELGRVCLCGCFNTTVAVRLLKEGSKES